MKNKLQPETNYRHL